MYCVRIFSEFRIFLGHFQRDIDNSTIWRWRLSLTHLDKGFDMLSSNDSRRTKIGRASSQLNFEDFKMKIRGDCIR